MLNILMFSQVVLGMLLTAIILLQPKKSSLNLVSFGNDGGRFEKRGAEKTLHNITIILGALFVINSLIYFFAA